MKNTLLLSFFLYIGASLNVCAQANEIIFRKTTDSTEVFAMRYGGEKVCVFFNHGGKVDTLWQNDIGRSYVRKILDIQVFKDRFAMICYGYSILVFVSGEWDGYSWQRKGIAGALAFNYANSTCQAEILDYNKVKVVQKGVSTITTYDTQTGTVLSRTTEKE